MKVNGRYYSEVLVKKQMLPVMRRIAGDALLAPTSLRVSAGQRTGAPRARETVQLLLQETPQFISPICGLLTVRT